MKKGQMSIDLLLAIVVAILFFTILNIHASNLEAQTQDAAIRNEMRTILFDVYAAAGTVKAYGVAVDYTSPVIQVGKDILPCTLQITKDQVIVKSDGQPDQRLAGLDLGNIQPESPKQCGFPITITRTES